MRGGRYYRDELMAPNVEGMCKNKLAKLEVDQEYYISHNELFIVDGQIEHNKEADFYALPKNNKGRAVGNPQVMKDITEYYMEQRKELAETFHFEFTPDDFMYEPIINTIKGSTSSVTWKIMSVADIRWRDNHEERWEKYIVFCCKGNLFSWSRHVIL